MNSHVELEILLGLCLLALSARGQQQEGVPRFEDFPVSQTSIGKLVEPILSTREERRYKTVITRGVTKGWGVEDGVTGAELATPGPNFAGHYAIVTWGCGSPCLMAAILDLKTGRAFPPPFHHGPGHSYFQVPWEWPMKAFDYRLDSRLLIANICEADITFRVEGRVSYQAERCGAHYFVMSDEGPRLIKRVLEK